MKRLLFLLCLMGVGFLAKAQTNPFPTTDSLERFINRWIRNSAVEAFQNLRLNTAMIGMLRFVQNSEIGSGVDTMYKLNDSTVRLITHAPDTFDVTLRFSGSGGGANANVGTGYRWVVVGTQNIKTAGNGYGILIDSATSNVLTFKADTSGTNGLVTRTELLDSTDITTQVESPIYVKLRSSWPVADTLALRRGYGLDTSSTGELRVDTFNISTRAWRQKLADSLGALITAGGGINQLTGDVTAGPGTGSQVATIAANAVTTIKIADNNVTNAKIVAFKPFPAERQWRTLYEKSSWADLADFSTSGTAVISLSGGYINITASTQDYTPRVYFKPEWATGHNFWKVTGRYKHAGFGSPSNWGGPFIKSLVNHDGANFGYQFFTSIANGGGNSFFTSENGTIIVSGGAGPSKALNDVMEFTMERIDTVLTYTIRNVTTSSATQTITYTFPAANTPNVLPNVGQLGFLMNAAGGTLQLQYLKIESSEIVAPNVLVIGNSKTANGATTFNRRFPSQLNATYPTVTWSAGSAERMEPDMFYKRPELTFRNPEYVILASVYDNDKRAGFTNADIIDDMIRLENYWIGGGATVLWMCLPEDSTAGGASGLTAIRNWLVSARPNNYINTWDSLRTSGSDNRLADIYDNGDGVHLNAAAHDKIVQTIIASGKVSTISPQRRVHIRSDDPNMRVIGDSVGLAFDWSRTAGNIPRVNSSWNVTSSNIWQNESGNVTIASTINPTPVLSNGLFNVQGVFSLSGSASSIREYDRTTPANFFESVINSNTKYISYGGVDKQYIGNDGQQRWGNGASVSSTLIPSTININRDYSVVSTFARKGFSFSSDSVTLTHVGSTALGDRSINSFHKANMAATGSTSYDTLSTVFIEGAPYDDANTTVNFPLALEVMAGKTHLGGGVSILNSPTAYGAYKLATINPDSTLGTVASSTFATQSALNDTAAAIRALITEQTVITSTTNGGSSVVIDIAITENTSGEVEVIIVGIGGTTLGSFHDRRFVMFQNETGSSPTVDATSFTMNSGNPLRLNGMDVSAAVGYSVSGENLRLTFTASTTEDVSWKVYYKIRNHTFPL